MQWLYLALAILSEVGAVISLRIATAGARSGTAQWPLATSRPSGS
jgi:multidrug transporter EmrE-like cation transporter